MNKVKIEWTNHIIELVVVSIGITAAFALNNWNEGKKEKQQEKNYIANLLEETNFNINQIKKVIKNAESDSIANFELINIFLKNKYDQENILPLISKMSGAPKASIRTATFESIKSSGGMEIMKNFELKIEVIENYILYENLNIIENITFDFLKTYWLPYLFTKIDLLNGKFENNDFMKDYSFKNTIVGYKTTLLQQLNSYKEALNKCENLKIALEKELK